MPRKSETGAPPVVPDAVPVVDPRAVYTVDVFQRLFRLRASTVRREVREGRLRVSKRAGRYFLLGEWVMDWLRAGELPSKKAAPVRIAEGAP